MYPPVRSFSRCVNKQKQIELNSVQGTVGFDLFKNRLIPISETVFLIISGGNTVVFFENFGKIRVVPVTDGIRRNTGRQLLDGHIFNGLFQTEAIEQQRD